MVYEYEVVSKVKNLRRSILIDTGNELADVVIPIYNGSKYVVPLLESIKAQTYRPINIYICDDVSTDDSYELVILWTKANAASGFSISCERNRVNVGLTGNTSKLLSKTKGKYVFIADQDDVWIREKITRQVDYFKNNKNCVINICDRSVTDANLNIKIASAFRYRNYSKTRMEQYDVIGHMGSFPANSMAIRNDDFNIFDIPDGIVQQDSFLAVMASNYGTIDFIYEPLLLYRIHGNNLSGNFAAEFSHNRLECFFRYLKVASRVCEYEKKDKSIISEEFRKRFGHEIIFSESTATNVKAGNIFLFAWRKTQIAYKMDKIGSFYKQKMDY